MDKYQNKYRVKSIRASWWDYKETGAYFITICTQHRKHYFGKITNGEMKLSSVGIIANILWHEIKTHTTNIELGEFVVMPNHIHGVLILLPNDKNDGGNDDVDNGLDNGLYINGNADTITDTNADTNADTNVETRHALSLRSRSPLRSPLQSQPQPQSLSLSQLPPSQPSQPSESYAQDRFRNPGKRSISSIIGGYKSAVTKHAHRMGIEFGWQSRFYDHIIRNDQSFQRISKYIIENPTKWGDDCFY
ncbi:transposase [Massilibacteroides vaginae]|uniref:transposase n=1 Tax=Massilibacteroides vaginae TaxID=1673718 RepID=UPI000A1CCE04|nr:transposase [Massilibacteroides vaginae]